MSNPYAIYKANYIDNLPSGVTYNSTIARFSYNGKRFITPQAVESYRLYLDKFEPPTPSVPSLIASDNLSGRTLTISVSSLTGTPTPSVSLTALTLDGVDVSGSSTGTSPFYYTVPDSTSDQTVAWTVTATNTEGSDTSSGSEVVAANQSLPLVSASDSLSGRDLTITVDAVTGDPAPSVALTTLTLDGVDVSGDVSGTGPWTYTVPDSSSDQTVAWTVTATNAVGSDTSSDTEVVAGSGTPAFDPEAGLTVTNTFAQGNSFFNMAGNVSTVLAFEVTSLTDWGKIMLPRFSPSLGVGIDADGRVFAGILNESLVVSDPGFTTGTVVIAIDLDADTLTLWVNGTQYDGVGSIGLFNRWHVSGSFEYLWSGNANTISGSNFPGFATSDVNWPSDQNAQGTFSDLRHYEDQTVNTQPEPAFDPEAGLTGAVTYAPGDIVEKPVNFDSDEPTVIAFTVPADWSDEGVVFDVGSAPGSAVVINPDGRVGAYTKDDTSLYNYVLSDTGALTPGDRVVVQWLVPSAGKPRIWIEGVEVTFETAEDHAYGSWCSGNKGTYLNGSANGQNGVATPLPTTGGWTSMESRPINTGTWGDLTLYPNQTIVT